MPAASSGEGAVDHLGCIGRGWGRCVRAERVDGGESVEQQGPDGVDRGGIVGAKAPPRAVQVERLECGPQARAQVGPGGGVVDCRERGVERPDEGSEGKRVRSEAIDVPRLGLGGIVGLGGDDGADRLKMPEPIPGIPEQPLLSDQRPGGPGGDRRLPPGQVAQPEQAHEQRPGDATATVSAGGGEVCDGEEAACDRGRLQGLAGGPVPRDTRGVESPLEEPGVGGVSRVQNGDAAGAGTGREGIRGKAHGKCGLRGGIREVEDTSRDRRRVGRHDHLGNLSVRGETLQHALDGRGEPAADDDQGSEVGRRD
ncbi:unannotated protein [freshwater metagenome]|uniref:Unannotated protein n=1 Tax=freshwater metagenome TaxID=449393 RepID=A0A6J6UB17_9ZZZZ